MTKREVSIVGMGLLMLICLSFLLVLLLLSEIMIGNDVFRVENYHLLVVCPGFI